MVSSPVDISPSMLSMFPLSGGGIEGNPGGNKVLSQDFLSLQPGADLFQLPTCMRSMCFQSTDSDCVGQTGHGKSCEAVEAWALFLGVSKTGCTFRHSVGDYGLSRCGGKP